MSDSLKYQAYYTKSASILNYMTKMLGLRDHDYVWEPCGGDGVFVDRVLEENSSVKIDVFELDPKAVSFLAEKYSQTSNVNIKRADTLLDEQVLSRIPQYDKIIGNPPYGARNTLEKKRKLNCLYPGLYVKESYTLFLYACTHCLKEGGILSFIIPDTFLSLHRHIAIRKFLLRNTKIKELSLFPSSFFPGVNFGYANLCVVTLEKSSDINRNLQNDIKIRTGFQNVEELDSSNCGSVKFLSQRGILNNIDSAFLLNSTDRILELLNNADLPKIGDLATCVTGFYSGDDKTYLRVSNSELRNAKRYRLIDNDLVQPVPSKREKLGGIQSFRCFVPIVKGGNIQYIKKNQWFMDWSVQAVLNYRTSKKSRFQNSEFYFKNGIAIPMIRSSKLTGALIEGRLFDQSIVGVFPKDESWIIYFLGFFNSNICTQLINAINPSANNSANYIKKIPVIKPTPSFRAQIESIVNRILMLLRCGDGNIREYEDKLNELFSDLYLKGIGRQGAFVQ